MIPRAELDETLEKHRVWLETSGTEGERADFDNANLRGPTSTTPNSPMPTSRGLTSATPTSRGLTSGAPASMG